MNKERFYKFGIVLIALLLAVNIFFLTIKPAHTAEKYEYHVARVADDNDMKITSKVQSVLKEASDKGMELTAMSMSGGFCLLVFKESK